MLLPYKRRTTIFNGFILQLPFVSSQVWVSTIISRGVKTVKHNILRDFFAYNMDTYKTSKFHSKRIVWRSFLPTYLPTYLLFQLATYLLCFCYILHHHFHETRRSNNPKDHPKKIRKVKINRHPRNVKPKQIRLCMLYSFSKVPSTKCECLREISKK